MGLSKIFGGGKMKVAINGFGRIGKQFFISSLAQGVKWDFVINELSDLDSIVYSLKYDSVHATPQVNISHDGKNLIVGNRKIKVFAEKDPSLLPWKDEKVDLVVECTGFFTNAKDAAKHVQAGALKVLISAPAKEHQCTLVHGVNSNALKKDFQIVSAGSCTTNCVAPMVKIINDAFKIKNAYFVTTHAYTATQRLVDAFDKKDFRRGRAAAGNIVPSTSGASISVVEAVPQLQGKLEGYALRVPVIDGSFSSVFAHVENPASVEEINALFKSKAQKEYKGVLQYSEDDLVSSDIIGNTHSCIFDSKITSVNGDLLSIAGWYDNEMGYSNRLVDVARLMLK